MDCVVGVMAHNEEASVGEALGALAGQAVFCARLRSIVVVASGCTDGTSLRVREAARSDSRIRLIEQPAREGKASAIRLFLHEVPEAEILVLAGADTRPRPGALEALIAPFQDPTVGMTGGRPIPLNPQRGLVNGVVHTLWRLHHEIALMDPKLGELVAFRNDIGEFPADTAVDEAMIERIVRSRGLRTVYVPEAEVEMRGPDRWRELLAQRRRIAAGHRLLEKRTGYRVSTASPLAALRGASRLKPLGGRQILWLAAAIPLEALARLLGAWDAATGRDHVVWRMASSSKDLGHEPPSRGTGGATR